ncbi:hypothetical protein LUZ60_003669 [Juncus effusus]|nr:hypothetical protein LUZ60_003669 [Juncus effusus]
MDSYETEEESELNNFSSLLDIYVHEARNISNICIYANQDVYAKFSLTSSPDETLSTRVVNGGGNNPHFNERLAPLRIPHPSEKAVMKVEIYMLSCAKSFLGDQLLGFTLIPISSIEGTPCGKLTQEFTLSSTDLFHSPAGTIQLTLTLNPHHSLGPRVSHSASSSITSEVVILDPKPVLDFNNIEFPDINVAQENQEMVMQYCEMEGPVVQPSLPFIRLVTKQPLDDCEMTMISNHYENSMQNSNNFTGSSSVTSLNNEDKIKIETYNNNCSMIDIIHASNGSPETPTSKEIKVLNKEKEINKPNSGFKSPLGDVKMEDEESEMQKQIVDMYMKSMQQFSESLSKMKIPMNIDEKRLKSGGEVIQSGNSDGDKLKNKSKSENKKDGSRVFYGSRAFF